MGPRENQSDEAERRARMTEDGVRPPDDEARERTRAFLGDLRRATAVVSRATTYGLGGVTITVAGDGRVELRKEGWGPEKPRAATVRLDATDTAAVFDAFVEHAFTEMVIAPHTGVPDELHYTISLTGDGGTHTLGKFVSARHARFMRLLEAVGQIVRKHLDPRIAERMAL